MAAVIAPKLKAYPPNGASSRPVAPLHPTNGEAGVWTINRDSMSSDSDDPFVDRTIHIDQYTGKILADVKYEDYSWAGKAMAVGIPFHMGLMGTWSFVLNVVFCLSVIFVAISGAVMWWMRRPSGAGRLAAPPMPRDVPLWQGAVLVGLAISLAFPMAGLTLLAVLALDLLIEPAELYSLGTGGH